MRLVGNLVYVDAAEMALLDREAIGTCRIDVLSLMENAGAATAQLASQLLGGTVKGKRVACITGKGNNGGDGLVASRRLQSWGAAVTVVLSSPRDQLGETAGRQLASVDAMGLDVRPADQELTGFDLLLDALLGYSSKGPPREPMASLIRRANESAVPILAIDIPSGLDPTSGNPYDPCIRAKATLTLGLPKSGFLNPRCRPFVGDLFLGDVSIPPTVYSTVGQRESPFERSPVVRIPW